jgi:hypothetical protein
VLESFADGGAREPQRCPQEVEPEKFGVRAVEPDKIGVLGLRLPGEVEHAAAVRVVEFVVAVNVHDGGVAESPAQQRECCGDAVRNVDIAGKHEHVDASRVERLNEGAPTVPVKLEVQVGEELEAHTGPSQGSMRP